MTETVFRHKLSRYMPETACSIAFGWLVQYPARLRITKPRTSKLGDFRVKDFQALPVISVNGDLNPYSFCITLAHEMAHLIDFKTRKNLRNPHGNHWKKIYGDLLRELLNARVFPPDLNAALEQHIRSPKAASCSDPELLRMLRRYDPTQAIMLEDLPELAVFQLANGRRFKKYDLRRTRYRCQDMANGRFYLISGQCEVEPL